MKKLFPFAAIRSAFAVDACSQGNDTHMDIATKLGIQRGHQNFNDMYGRFSLGRQFCSRCKRVMVEILSEYANIARYRTRL